MMTCLPLLLIELIFRFENINVFYCCCFQYQFLVQLRFVCTFIKTSGVQGAVNLSQIMFYDEFLVIIV